MRQIGHTITPSEHMTAYGLVSQANAAYREMRRLERQIAELLNVSKTTGDAAISILLRSEEAFTVGQFEQAMRDDTVYVVPEVRSVSAGELQFRAEQKAAS